MPLYKGAAKRLDDIDLPRVGSEIGVGEDVIHALLEVETRGTGFDDKGRVLLLFEPHKFYAKLRGQKRERAVAEGLAYPKWGEKKYPRDSYPRLIKAMNIDETAALESASWGLGQVMGENHEMLGYQTVQSMVAAFAADEEAHLRGMIDFIREAGIGDDLRRIEAKTERGQPVTAADWVPVVRVYNGPGYAKNNYHNRAAAAYNKWLRIKDTPFAEGDDIRQRAAEEEAANAVEDVTPDSEQGAVVAEELPDPARVTHGHAAPAVEAQNIEKVEVNSPAAPVKGGGLSDKVIAIQSTLEKTLEKAKPVIESGSDTTKNWSRAGILSAALMAVVKWATDPQHLLPVIVFVGVGLLIMLFWLWTRYSTKRDVRQKEHELKMKALEVDLQNAQNLGDPQRLNAVVVPEPAGLVVQRHDAAS